MQKRRVFPLMLTPFERFLLLVDDPVYPSTSIITYEFTGEAQKEHFDAALDEALLRHPLLTAVVRPGKRGLPCFVLAPTPRPPVYWGAMDTPLETPNGERIDIANEVGLRIWVRTGDDRTSLTIQVHHCCTDGIGIQRFIGDMLTVYAQRTATTDDVPELADLEIDRLQLRWRRAYYGPTDPTQPDAGDEDPGNLGFRRLARDGLKYVMGHLTHGVTPMAHPPIDSQEKKLLTTFPNLHYVLLDKAQCKSMRQKAVAHGVSVNDVLVAALFTATVRWNEETSGRAASSRLQFLVPTDLRERGDERCPAANFVGWLHISRKASECRDVVELARSIFLEMRQARREGADMEFTRALTAGYILIPKALPALLGPRGRSFPTGAMTNLGDVSRRFTSNFPRVKGRLIVGNLAMDSVISSAPIDPKTRLSVAANSYMRTMSLTLRADPYRFDDESLRRFMTMYLESLAPFMPETA